MADWEGQDRRGQTSSHYEDWLQHKMMMLSDINTLKTDNTQMKRDIADMKVTLEVLKSKVITIVTGLGIVVSLGAELLKKAFG